MKNKFWLADAKRAMSDGYINRSGITFVNSWDIYVKKAFMYEGVEFKNPDDVFPISDFKELDTLEIPVTHDVAVLLSEATFRADCFDYFRAVGKKQEVPIFLKGTNALLRGDKIDPKAFPLLSARYNRYVDEKNYNMLEGATDFDSYFRNLYSWKGTNATSGVLQQEQMNKLLKQLVVKKK